MPNSAPGSPDPGAEAAVGLGLYVHWPFCTSLCPYCDFNSHVRERLEPRRWAAAYAADIRRLADRLGRRRIDTVFFGGGTPSLMDPAALAQVTDALAACFELSESLEMTLEANPTSADAARFGGFAQAGINRLSIGVQALNDADLAWLGRRHSVAEALAAIETASKTFGRVSFDLIYGRPGQSPAAWRRELAQALALGVDHLSLYQLTVEAGTVFFARRARGEAMTATDDLAADLFEMTQEHLAEAGLPAYEISNHARAGEACRHNLGYWRQSSIAGIGPGAHGRLTLAGRRYATRAHRAPEIWLAAQEGGQSATTWRTLDRPDWFAEVLMMGLRLAEGVPWKRLEEIAGDDLETWLPAHRLAPLEAAGWLQSTMARTGRLVATAPGRQRLNALLARMLAD